MTWLQGWGFLWSSWNARVVASMNMLSRLITLRSRWLSLKLWYLCLISMLLCWNQECSMCTFPKSIFLINNSVKLLLLIINIYIISLSQVNELLDLHMFYFVTTKSFERPTMVYVFNNLCFLKLIQDPSTSI